MQSATVRMINALLKIDPGPIKVPFGEDPEKIKWTIDENTLPGWTFDRPFAITFDDPGPFSKLNIGSTTLSIFDDNSTPGVQVIGYRLFLLDQIGGSHSVDPEIENEEGP